MTEAVPVRPGPPLPGERAGRRTSGCGGAHGGPWFAARPVHAGLASCSWPRRPRCSRCRRWPADLAAGRGGAARRPCSTDDEYLTEIASHLIVAGRQAAAARAGRRRRPLTARRRRPPTTWSGAGVSVELVHLGSLYHDDVMDEAATRRRRPSVNARWGNLRAILAGDFLLARASEIAAVARHRGGRAPRPHHRPAVRRPDRELRTTFDARRTEEAYLDSITGKTASLFAAAGRIGGIVAGLDRPADRCAHRATASAYGMVFQIVDDVLDLTATEAQLGKPAGHDLVEGVYTLPVIAHPGRRRRGRRRAGATCSGGRSTGPSSTRPSPSCARAPV